MKKIYLFISAFFVLFLLVGCWKKGWSEILENNSTGDQQQAVVEANQEWKFRTTMEAIFKKWKATTCDFLITEDGQTFNWALYVDGKKMRYSSKWSFQWQNIEFNVVVKDNYSYSWNNMEPNKWYKMKEANWNEQNNSDVGPEERGQEMEFDCKKWVAAWMFDLPSAIMFEEMPTNIN